MHPMNQEIHVPADFDLMWIRVDNGLCRPSWIVNLNQTEIVRSKLELKMSGV